MKFNVNNDKRTTDRKDQFCQEFGHDMKTGAYRENYPRLNRYFE